MEFLDFECESCRAAVPSYLSELLEVLELDFSGDIHVETEVASLDDDPKAYEKLHAGQYADVQLSPLTVRVVGGILRRAF